MSNPAIEKTIADYYQAIRALDCDAWLATMSADVVAHDPVGAEPMTGLAAHRIFFTGLSGILAQADFAPDSMFVSGPGAAVKWSARVTGTSGREARCEGITVFEFDARGKIQRRWSYWDPGALIAALEA
ncbi:MAG TPA: nuclear transport factor 2 family protein [Polyangia bacterium]|nr:nuclear transport factor 2 family protein [Polyangia bacterium]